MYSGVFNKPEPKSRKNNNKKQNNKQTQTRYKGAFAEHVSSNMLIS